MGLVFVIVGIVTASAVLGFLWSFFDEPDFLKDKKTRNLVIAGAIVAISLLVTPFVGNDEIVVTKTAITNYLEVSDELTIAIEGDPMKITWDEITGKNWWTVKYLDKKKRVNFKFEYTFEISK